MDKKADANLADPVFETRPYTFALRDLTLSYARKKYLEPVGVKRHVGYFGYEEVAEVAGENYR